MKILTGKDIREADLRTIAREPVASIDLMERAAIALEAEIADAAAYLIIAGKGNNGGDGLAVARLLKRRFGDTRGVSVILLAPSDQLSPDCRHNLALLPPDIAVFYLDGGHITADGSEVPPEQLFRGNTVVIDAILGTGITGAVRGAAQQAIRLINEHSGRCRMVISIDLPSGRCDTRRPYPGHRIPEALAAAAGNREIFRRRRRARNRPFGGLCSGIEGAARMSAAASGNPHCRAGC